MVAKDLSGLFLPQLGCLRLRQELLSIGEEKLLRMQVLIKLLTKLAVQGDA